MSRLNRRKPGGRRDVRPTVLFTPPPADDFSELELEFFRQGDQLALERADSADEPPPPSDPVWAVSAAEPAS